MSNTDYLPQDAHYEVMNMSIAMAYGRWPWLGGAYWLDMHTSILALPLFFVWTLELSAIGGTSCLTCFRVDFLDIWLLNLAGYKAE